MFSLGCNLNHVVIVYSFDYFNFNYFSPSLGGSDGPGCLCLTIFLWVKYRSLAQWGFKPWTLNLILKILPSLEVIYFYTIEYLNSGSTRGSWLKNKIRGTTENQRNQTVIKQANTYLLVLYQENIAVQCFYFYI